LCSQCTRLFRPCGGYFVWLRVGNAKQTTIICKNNGIRVLDGMLCAADSSEVHCLENDNCQQPCCYLRLSFAWLSKNDLEQGNLLFCHKQNKAKMKTNSIVGTKELCKVLLENVEFICYKNNTTNISNIATK
jgi:hypothetical protein